MEIERVGYRRLYDSMGCSLDDADELHISIPMADLQAEVYLGARPKLGIFVGRSDKYAVGGENATLFQGEYKGDATESRYPRHFFTEILCLKHVEIPDELSEAFLAKDPAAQENLLQIAQRSG